MGHGVARGLYGGARDNTLTLSDDSFRRVDGGSGDDTLVLGEDVVLDFTEAADLGRGRGIEAVSLSGASAMVALEGRFWSDGRSRGRLDVDAQRRGARLIHAGFGEAFD